MEIFVGVLVGGICLLMLLVGGWTSFTGWKPEDDNKR